MAAAFRAGRGIRSLHLAEVPDGFPESESLCTIHDFWLGKCRGSHLPARQDLPPSSLRPWIGHVSLVDVAHDPRRFRWRLIGSRISEALGRDGTGQWFEQLYEGRMLADYVRFYSAAVERRRPVFYRGDLEFLGKEHIRFRSVHLPMADGDAPVSMLLLCLHFDI
ncbi:MAG: PAS domain-containing protein [Sneathiellaceae bacterium]